MKYLVLNAGALEENQAEFESLHQQIKTAFGYCGECSTRDYCHPIPHSNGINILVPIIGNLYSVLTPEQRAAYHYSLSLTGDFYQLDFEDDFDGPELDRSIWKTHYWEGSTYTPQHNRQMEYVDNPAVLDLSEPSLLRITAQPGPTPAGFEYKSGVICSSPQPTSQTNTGYTFEYGYAEAYVKNPDLHGSFPAFWFIQDGDVNWLWEVDAWEHLGKDPRIGLYHDYWWDEVQEITKGTGVTPNEGFHIPANWIKVGVDWTPTSYTWYRDGQVKRIRTAANGPIGSGPAHLIANFAIGGGGPGTAVNAVGKSFDIDYIRVFKKVAGY